MSIEDGEAFADLACSSLAPISCEPVHVVAAAVLHDGGYLVARRSPGKPTQGNGNFRRQMRPGEDWSEAIARSCKKSFHRGQPTPPARFLVPATGWDGFVIHLIACELVDLDGTPSLTVHDASMWRSGSSTSPFMGWSRRGNGCLFARPHQIHVDDSPSSSIERSSLMWRGT